MLFRASHHYWSEDSADRLNTGNIIDFSSKLVTEVGRQILVQFFGELNPDIKDPLDHRHRRLSIAFYAFTHKQLHEIRDMIPEEHLERFNEIRDGRNEDDWRREPRHKG